MKKKIVTVVFLVSLLICNLISSLSPAQTQSWVERFNGSQNQTDQGSVLYVDGAGNSYVAGYGYTISGGEDIEVVKYNINGNQMWVDTVGTTGIDWANAITVDDSGDVFITGYVTDITNGSLMVYKFDANGVQKWERFFGCQCGVSDEGMAITCDANYVYATGAALPSATNPQLDYVTAKFDIATGTMQSGWPQRYNGTGNSTDRPTSIAVDASGNVYVTGWSTSSSGDKDFATIAYSPSGAILSGWPQTFDGSLSQDDIAVQLLLYGSNVVVTGRTNATSNSSNYGDICTIMYNSSGGVVSGWPQIYGSAANDGVGNTGNNATYKPMAVSDAGNVYVTAWSTNTTGNYDMVTLAYNATGATLSGWPQRYDNGGKDDIPRGLALDAFEDVYITGFTAPAGTFTGGDYVTIRYNKYGVQVPGWPVMYNGPANGDDEAQAIAALGQCVWVTGYSVGNGTFDDIATIKYCDLGVGINNPSNYNKDVAIYPNPSNGLFILHNTDAAKGHFSITNTLGEIIYQSEITSRDIQIDLANQAQGIYFLRLTTENNSFTLKLVKE